MIESTDISFVLSGGSGNSSASLSLGGEPSNTLIGSSINNLFDDVTSAEAEDGNIDYRCFYIFNDHETESLYNSKIYVKSQASGGATILLGLKRSNDIQTVHIESTGDISSGTITLSLEGNNIVLNYDPDLGTMQQSLEDAINAVDEGYEATVSTSAESLTDFTFSVTFGGYKYFELMTVVSNSLVTSGVATITIDKNTDGGPVNTFAEEIDNDAIEPNGVVFQSTSSFDNALEVAHLRPGEGFPVWAKRTTLAGTENTQNDNFVLVLIGNPTL